MLHCLKNKSSYSKVLFIALLLILPFFLTACSLQDLPVVGKYLPNLPGLPNASSIVPSGKTTLNVWGLYENPQVMAALIQKYQATHPNVTINYQDRSLMSTGDYKSAVFNRSASSSDADVVLVHDSWVPNLKSSLAPMPSNTMTAQTYAQTFYSAASQEAVDQGKVYAIPAYYDGLALVYNKKQFEEINQQLPPTSWEEFRRVALSLSQKSEGTLVRGGAAIGNANNVDFFSDILGMFFAQAGVNVPQDIDSSFAKDALTYYTNFVKTDGVWNDSFPEASAAFSKEQVSMIFVPAWNLLDILKARPDMDVGVAPVPQAQPQQPASWGSFWMYAVPSSSKNSAAAWDFLKYLSTEDAQLTMFSEASKYRQFGEPYSLVSLSSQLSSQQYLKPYLDTAPFSKSNELAARSGNDAQVKALKDAVNAVLAGQDATTALQTAKAAIMQAK
jgi:multiple sugar transport system substrate-binding protein